jgi:hypothetical protein
MTEPYKGLSRRRKRQLLKGECCDVLRLRWLRVRDVI